MLIDYQRTKILLIDNSLENWRCLSGFLAETKYSLQRVSTAKISISSVSELMPDLILIDSSIDKIDGLSFCQNLKAEKSLQDISILLLTYIEQLSEYSSYFQIGVSDFISKPLRQEEFLLRMRNQLKIQSKQKNQLEEPHQSFPVVDGLISLNNALNQNVISNKKECCWQLSELNNEESINQSLNSHSLVSSNSKITSSKNNTQEYQTNTVKLYKHNLVLTKLGKNPILYQGNLKTALAEITNVAAHNLGIERASIWLYDETLTKIQCADLFEYSRNQHSAGMSLSAKDYPTYFQALHQDEAIAADDAYTDPRTKEFAQSYLTPLNITAMLDTPIRLAGETVGVLCLEAVKSPHHWTPEDQNFARSLTNLVSLALEARERQRAEAAHRISEQKLASAFRASPDPITLCTYPETRYIEVNDSFCRLFGYSRSQVIGNTDKELNIWVNLEECNFLSRILEKAKAIRNHEVDFRTSSGEIKTTLFSAEMIEIDGQKYILGTAKDITERKQAEAESRLLLLTTQAIARAVDVKSALTLVLRVICQTIGWDFGEAWTPNRESHVLEHSLVCYCEEASLEEFCHQSQNLRIAPGDGLPGRVWQTKQSEWIEDVSQVKQGQFLRSPQAAKVGLKAGFGIPILAGKEVLAVLIFFKRSSISIDKRLLMLLGAVATQLGSLIERKLIESAHRKSEERLQLALEASDLGLWDWNIATGKIYRDWQWQKMLGYAQEDIEDDERVIQQLLHPEDLAGVTSAIADHLQGVTPVYEMEFRMRCAAGGWKWVQSRGQIVERDEQGQPLRMTGTTKDITERKILEKELELREARLNAFFSGAPVGMSIFDDQLRFVQINELIADIHGKSAQEHIGRTLEEIAPQIAPLVTPFCQQVLLTSQPILNVELSLPAVNQPDSLRHFLVSYFPIPGEGNQLSGVGKVIVEISDRQRAEEALKESVERERAIAQVIQRMRQTLDLDTIFTATTEELRQVLNCDRAVVYRFDSQGSGEFVAESWGKDWISLMETHKNAPHLTENTVQDQSCLAKLLEYTPQSTPDKNFLCVSDIYQAGFGSCYIEFLERLQAKAYIIVPILSGDQVWGLLATYQNSGPRQWKTGEINIVIQIGNQLEVALQQAQLLTQTQRQSQALEAAAIAADGANRAKSEFLANMSHELRTPLNAILGFTQIMSHDKTLSKDNQQNLTIINRAGEHLLDLINDVLEMSKIEAGRTTLNINNFDLIHLLDNLQEMMQGRAKAKGLHLQFEYAPNIAQHIQADESKLRQVLLNILGNAIKFTETGSIILRVKMGDGDWGLVSQRGLVYETLREGGFPHVGVSLPVKVQLTNSEGGTEDETKTHLSTPNTQFPITNPRFLIFEIQDTGIGICDDEVGVLFEAFGQTEAGRKSQQGTGLGLAISRKYVQLMGGDISISSTVGVGSTFSFRIQVGLVSAHEIPCQPTARSVIGLAPQQQECRILVVDDVADSRLLLVKLLSSVGFVVQEAANGQEALAIWQQWHPQLILMDMRMPIMDGYEATHFIRSAETENHTTIPNPHTIIIALTAHAFEEQRQAMLQVGCDDLINKPFSEKEILEKLNKYLGIKYLYQEDSSQTLKARTTIFAHDNLLPLLSTLPRDWVINLYNAAAQCSDDLILKLTEEISCENTALKEYFVDLAHNFQFEKIMQIVSTIKDVS
ncbi:GAF domain-containing protein [Trichormus variabilis]|uniref:histidine kinase n=1 Tax=Trichormus variabilis N2B TaxID=2681315 RepID=A0ABR6S7V9_ANAVA|nr:GAF domain-containing protein [Trichormus variabilis]MBC1302494.1 PAS domain S-box protein [Trichormus variabilis N2B]